MKMKGRLLSILTLVVVLIIAWIVFNQTNQKPVTYEDFGSTIPEGYPYLGIDVSHYQKNINWSYASHMKKGDDSIQFVFIKATEGVDFTDEQFETNAKGANLEELYFGCYHFYDPALPARVQANYFSSVIKESDFNLRPVLDIEVSGDLRRQEIIDSVRVFLATVESNLSARPIIYTYENFFMENLVDPMLNAEDFWIANYNGSSRAMDLPHVLIWQFSESGTVNGIVPKVDLNVAKEGFLEICQIKKE